MFRANLITNWTLIMILTDMFHIHVAITMLSNLNVELESHQKSLGFAAFMAWNGLASYLVHYKDYAYIPNTIFTSGVAVLYGIIGIFPVAMGLAIITSIQMGYFFRMKDPFSALFTMYYYMYGDADFDVLYGANQVDSTYTIAWGLLWLWFGNNIIINLTLAVVENGYLE